MRLLLNNHVCSTTPPIQPKVIKGKYFASLAFALDNGTIVGYLSTSFPKTAEYARVKGTNLGSCEYVPVFHHDHYGSYILIENYLKVKALEENRIATVEVYSVVCSGCLQLKLPDIEASIRNVREMMSNSPEFDLKLKQASIEREKWLVEGFVDFEGSEYLIASSPQPVQGALEKCARLICSEKSNISYDEGPVMSTKRFSFTMLKLDTTQSSRPQLKDTVGPIELLDISQANVHIDNSAKFSAKLLKLQKVVADLFREHKVKNVVVRIKAPRITEYVQAAVQIKPVQNNKLAFNQAAPAEIPRSKNPVETKDMWIVESVFDFDGSKFLMASNPNKVQKAKKKTARLVGSDHISPHVGSIINLNGKAFIMLRLSEEYKPKLNEMIGPVECIFMSYGERSREVAWKENRKLKEVVGKFAKNQRVSSTMPGILLTSIFEPSKSGDESDVGIQDKEDAKLPECIEDVSTGDQYGGASRIESSEDKESVRTYLAELLKGFGPIKYDDPSFWDKINASSVSVIGGKTHIRDFVMVDPRFRIFQDYICLIEDLAKCIQIHSDEMNPTTEKLSSAEDCVDLQEETETTLDEQDSTILKRGREDKPDTSDLSIKRPRASEDLKINT